MKPYSPKVYSVGERVMIDLENYPTGLQGFISWNRLSKYLEEKECNPGECITHFHIDDHGIQFNIGKK